MSDLIKAIQAANIPLKAAGLPSYDQVVELLQAAENKLEGMQRYHGAGAAQSIEAFRAKINALLEPYPYP
jgi:hypothetical protein